MTKIARQIFKFLSSLKLAVVVLCCLTLSLMVGTVLESLYDTPTAQYFVYRSLAFHLILGFLGLNIFTVALSRWPWKTRHIPFLIAHLGILTLLAGSWVTERTGIDGSVRITEGDSASVVDLDTSALVISERDRVSSVPIRWVPPGVGFNPVRVKEHGLPYDLTVDQFYSHADSVVSFVADPDARGAPALRLKLKGGPMGLNQDLWLWQGDPGWASYQAGPARFSFGEVKGVDPSSKQPWIGFKIDSDGSLSYTAHSSKGALKKGSFSSRAIRGAIVEPGWKGLSLTVEEYVPHANPKNDYQLAHTLYGQQAPGPAIHVVAGTGGAGSEVWLGLGDRAVLHLVRGEVEIGYFPKRVVLPFSVKLERFRIEHYEGTADPSSYSSQVRVIHQGGSTDTLISMNEPLKFAGFTLYQASFEDAQPRPVTSILSVNRDPGRPWKYLGSLLIVFGTVMLFASKLAQKKKSVRAVAPEKLEAMSL